MFEPITADQMQRDYQILNDVGYFDMTPRELFAIQCKRHGLSMWDMRGRDRHQEIAHIRQDCMAEMWRKMGLSYPRIGRMYGRHHSTVMAAIKASDERAAKRRAAQ